MRLLPLFLTALFLSGCARIAVLREITPVFSPASAGVKVQIDSHAKAFREATIWEKKDPARAGAAYLAALQEAHRELQENPSRVSSLRAYNFALDRMFSLVRAQRLQPWDRPVQFGSFTFGRKGGGGRDWTPSQFEFLPVDQVEVGGEYLRQMTVRPGIGASLVAIGQTPESDYRDRFSQPRTYYGVSATAEFRGFHCEVSFYDPMDVEQVRVGKRTFPLAADFTTPLAVLLTRERPERLGLVRLLDPDKYADTARISRIRPYSRNRIPLLLVHGLLDTPATWVPMVNQLRADPEIRKHYQIWVYSYPSGYPYPYSAALLRRELDRMKKVYPDHLPMVYVGHSMGGMIGRLMVTDSGDKIWDAYFRRPPDQVRMSAKEKQLMQDMLIFRARPEISRAIFICSPHRGAKLASTWLASMGRRLVRVPQTMIQLGDAIRQVLTLSEGGLAYESLPTSIDTLTTNNLFVKTVDTLPINPRIPFHSIMGDRGRAKARLDPSKGSDGYVAWISSHLPGAVSEKIIPSHHSGHQHPEGIAEVRRILLQHLHKTPASALSPQPRKTQQKSKPPVPVAAAKK